MSELNEPNTAEAGSIEGIHPDEIIDQGLGKEIEGEKFLTFQLNATAYGVEIKRIKEIIEFGGLTRIPMTPACIRGVINLRGNVVPIVDLAERVGIKSETESHRTCIIIVEIEDEGENLDLGFVVDGVDQVVGIAEENIEAAPTFGTEIKSEFISGMGNVNDDFVVLLDLDSVLSVSELSELVAAVAE